MTEDFFNFLKNSKTVFHTVSEIEKKLGNFGFANLNENEKWCLEKGRKYFIKRNDSSIIGFFIPKDVNISTGFNIVASHTDSPCLKLKTETAFNIKDGKIYTEVYGSPIISSWFDRPLSVAGKIYYRDKGMLKSLLVDFERPIGTIPNLAIHLNRDVNKGFEYNKQNHLNPMVLSNLNSSDSFKNLFKEQYGILCENLLSADLFLYETTLPEIIGIDKEMFLSSKIDNLSMCFASLQSICHTENPKKIIMSVWFDNEEIGSKTVQGADSVFLKDILKRIILTLGGDSEDFYIAISNSFMISADGVHAVHPNFKEKHDLNYLPEINKGVTVKFNANQRYSTNAETAAFFIDICEKAGIPYQRIINRSDITSGSTIGPLSSSNTGIQTVDAGNPMLAMHSIRELAGLKDMEHIIKAFDVFYKE